MRALAMVNDGQRWSLFLFFTSFCTITYYQDLSSHDALIWWYLMYMFMMHMSALASTSVMSLPNKWYLGTQNCASSTWSRTLEAVLSICRGHPQNPDLLGHLCKIIKMILSLVSFDFPCRLPLHLCPDNPTNAFATVHAHATTGKMLFTLLHHGLWRCQI